MKASLVLGRLIYGGYFLYNGINHFQHHGMLTQYAGAKHVSNPEAAVSASGALLVAGGASVAFGIKPKLGALAIIGFLASVSPAIHDFWKAEDPNQRMNDMTHFTKNMALIGGALILIGAED